MAIARVGGTTDTTGTTAVASRVTTYAATAGNTVLVWVSSRTTVAGTNNITSVTPNVGSAFTRRQSGAINGQASSGNGHVECFTGTNVSAFGSITVTPAASNTFSVVIVQLSGVDATTPFEVVSVGSGTAVSGSIYNLLSTTPLTTGAWIFQGGGQGGWSHRFIGCCRYRWSNVVC